MFTIDLLVRYIPVPLSVEKKEESDAQALYTNILEIIKSKEVQVVQLTCDKQTDKKIAVLSDQITGVIISQKDAVNAGSKAPGFFAALAEK
ncbi:MAG: hypothetical protein GW856_12710 [Cyanobacteria bacterium]|jgi:hypothetical protein|uniref:hypothetical protein n=1 Tax=Geminocystis sp. TaxID=2664100 RepID=UPI001D9274EA|nr:hypothetical protein [Cyanobacteria bacterium CG_2015-16_32_12]NCO79498.1 hypothetical protein [Cyanobacteria bacterium CG_2015-22_32_23]NCS85474.1 hypothetical protein [Cyanobacteria bacterium CG_2015-02_32_10]